MDGLHQLTEYRCPRFQDYPAIPLYKDQVVAFLTQAVAPFYQGAPAPVTASMINNYVKLKVIAPPERKKYTRHQLICLYVIFLFKQVLSMDEIRLLLQREFSPEAAESSYERFSALLEGTLASLASGEPLPGFGEHPLLEAAIRSFVYKRYAVVLLGQTEAPAEESTAE